MTNQIEPYSMIQKTNIKEHNDMVNKINEIVDVINVTNLDTINAEISGLKAKATATDTEIANIKTKDTTQDTEIDGITKSLVSNVTATFDNPSRELRISLGREVSPSIDATVVIPASSETGQYSAGNGITIQNYQIAVDTGVVALKSDIPVVPDVTEINNRLDTIDGEITEINTDITNIINKNTEQDTAIAGKVAISQGVENAGKVLGIGSDGNVSPVNAGGGSGGGEVWEEVDLQNWPTDWKTGDRFKISFKVNLTSTPPYIEVDPFDRASQFIETEIRALNSQQSIRAEILRSNSTDFIIFSSYEPNNFNDMSGDKVLFSLSGYYSGNSGTTSIYRGNISTHIYKVYRLK